MPTYFAEIALDPKQPAPPIVVASASDGTVWSIKAGAFVDPVAVAEAADRHLELKPHPDPLRPNVRVATIVEGREPPPGVDYTLGVLDPATGQQVDAMALFPAGAYLLAAGAAGYPYLTRR